MSASVPVPIRRLTLYKHGVAFVEREGALAQNSAEPELATINVDSTAATPA